MKKNKLYVISGAGLSAESGLPTFRTGGDALWDNYPLEKVCYLPQFENNYDLSHEFYKTRAEMYANVKPNSAHNLIAKFESMYGAERVINLTTNVDLLLESAGCTNVHHIHGRIDEVIRNWDFVKCRGTHAEPWGDLTLEKAKELGAVIKPNVVFFGESLNYYKHGAKPLYTHMFSTIDNIEPNDVVIVIGSSDQVINFTGLIGNVKCFSVCVNPAFVGGMYDVKITKPVCEAIDRLEKIVTEKMM